MSTTLDDLEYKNPHFSRHRYEAPLTTITRGPITYTYIWPNDFHPVLDPKPTLQGWECPKCDRIYAPWVVQCPYCGLQYSVTWKS